VEKDLGSRRSLKVDKQLKYKGKRKRVEDCTSELGNACEIGGLEILEEFLKNKLDEERSHARKKGKFAIIIDEEVDKE
jgi:hypothetical protein